MHFHWPHTCYNVTAATISSEPALLLISPRDGHDSPLYLDISQCSINSLFFTFFVMKLIYIVFHVFTLHFNILC